MIETQVGDMRLLQFEGLSQQGGLVHGITTKPQNMAPHRGVGHEESIRHRRQLCDGLGVAFEKLTAPQQVHGADVLTIEETDVGCGRDGRGSAVRFVDGLMTDRHGVPILVLSADCPVVCVYDFDRQAVGAVHASWRGTVAGAAANLVRQMVGQFGSRVEHLAAAITPSAGPCCYEVGPEVRRVARTRLADAEACFVEKKGRILFDLWKANRRQLVDEGIPAERIETAGLCSMCDDRFWSHRRDGSEAGRFGLIVALR